MRYVVTSYGRADNMVAFESIPEQFLQHIDLWVMPEEYKQYKDAWYGNKVRSINRFEPYMDCLYKKKRFFYEKLKGPYMQIDDDQYLFAWDQKHGRYVKAKDAPELFLDRMLDVIPRMFEVYNMVAICRKQLSTFGHARNGKAVLENELGSAAAGFSGRRPKDIWHNRILFTVDQPIPIQNFLKTKSAAVYTGLATFPSTAKAIRESGVGDSRTDFLAANDALKCMQLFPGVIEGFTRDEKMRGNFIIFRRHKRIVDGVTQAHIDESRQFIKDFCVLNGLRRPPKIFEYKDTDKFSDICDRVVDEWRAAGGKIAPGTYQANLKYIKFVRGKRV